MGVMLLNSADVNRCPRHVLDASHYGPDGTCRCDIPAQMTLRQKEQAALARRCPVCRVTPGNPCLNQNSVRKISTLKRPHAERVRLIDPDYTGNNYFRRYRPWRIRQVAG